MKSKGEESTYNKQIKKLIDASEEKYRQLLKNSFDMIVLLDERGFQHYVSESCEKILGYHPEELKNIDVMAEMIHPDDKENTRKAFRELMQSSKIQGVQYRHKHKNGSWVYLEANGTNQIKNPQIQSLVLNVRDITVRKKMEESLKESEARLGELNAMKDRFFSIIAHDLKSPFNSIIGFCELLEEEVRDENYTMVEEYATIIQNSSKRAMTLLTNLLEWSMTQSGRREYNPEYFELVALTNEVLDLFRESASQKGIQLERNTPNSLPIFADRAMISTILRNLISNGIKFTNAEGNITIAAKQLDRGVEILVKDTGIGMRQSDMDKLFRLDVSHSTPGTNKETGTGLGLLLCKEFIDMHKGTIDVQSQVGQGSVFKLIIPIDTQEY